MAKVEIPPRNRLQVGDSVLFFPTYGCLAPNERLWKLPVHGVVLQRDRVPRHRAAILGLIRRYLARELTAEQQRLFAQRSQLFQVNRCRGRAVSVQVAGQEFLLERTTRNGYFRGVVELPADLVEAAGALSIEVASGYAIPSSLGQGTLLSPTGLSVISDIDDTIKQTEVWNRRRMLENTFLRPFEAIPGMPEYYRKLEELGAAFHYVSASPWQLAEPLWSFLAEAGFPAGSCHLKLARPRHLPWWQFLARGNRGKLPILTQLLEAFPGRQFVLVGDTAARDPALYEECLRKYPDRVNLVLLRHLEHGKWSKEGVSRLYRGLAAEKWALYSEDSPPNRLPQVLQKKS